MVNAIITVPSFVPSADLVAHLNSKGWTFEQFTLVGSTLLCFHWEVATDAIGFWY